MADERSEQAAQGPGRDVEEEYGADPDGRPVLRHRVVDTLGRMLKAGTISPEMHDAAKDFQAAFIVPTSTRYERFQSCGCLGQGASRT